MSLLGKLTIEKNRFPQLVSAFPNAVAKLMNNAVMNVIYQADPLTPVDTGALRANKTILLADPGKQEASVTWNQGYAVYQEFGTVHLEGAHFAQGAVDKITPGYNADLGNLEGQL
ncbi:MAG TPA: HK97 gp10 family phage protein [Thermomicrobiales bacterium]|nr:HK97 gp10 family phage protein [Thermomicrobiales bacterium]